MKGVVGLAKQIDTILVTFAQAMPEGAQQFKQAAELIQQGIATAIEATSGPGAQAPTSAPTEVGNEFPGGGLGAGARP